MRLLLLYLAWQTPAPVTRIGDELACECRLSERAVAVLRGATNEDDAFPLRVRVDSAGRYWVFRRGSMPSVLDARGQFLRTVGQKGSGPGEFTEPYDVLIASRDTLVVLDSRALRATVLDGNFKAVRYVTLPFGFTSGVVMSWPRSILGSGTFPMPGVIGQPLHEFSFATSQASATRTFGPGVGGVQPRSNTTVSHTLARASGTTFWSAWRYGYNLYYWNGAGSLARSIERRPEWFRNPAPSRLGGPTIPPDPFVADLQVDAGGLVWVFIRVPAPTWKEAWPMLPPGTREVSGSAIAYEKLHTTTIEVLDPAAGKVVARHNVNSYFVSALPGHRAAFYSVDADGNGRLSVIELSLVGR